MMKKILNEWRKFLLSENVQKTDYVKGGKIKLYHYTTSWRLYTAESFIMDPMFFVKSRGTYSRNEWNASGVPRSFFYIKFTISKTTKKTQKESQSTTGDDLATTGMLF